MIKFKAISATLLAASAIGVGSLVNAPAASAMRPECDALAYKSQAYYTAYEVMNAYGETYYANYYLGMSHAYLQMAAKCYGL